MTDWKTIYEKWDLLSPEFQQKIIVSMDALAKENSEDYKNWISADPYKERIFSEKVAISQHFGQQDKLEIKPELEDERKNPKINFEIPNFGQQEIGKGEQQISTFLNDKGSDNNNLLKNKETKVSKSNIAKKKKISLFAKKSRTSNSNFEIKIGLGGRVKNASFRLFGKVIPNFPNYKLNYQKSGIGLVYESYLSVMLLSCVLAFIVTFAATFLFHILILHLPYSNAIGAASSLSMIITLIVAISYVNRPLWLVRQKKAQIDANLIYTVGYMGVLSAGGLPIERVFNRVAEVEPRPAIKSIATKFVANVRMFGMDVASSIDDVRSHSASDILAKLLESIKYTIKTSGDLKSLLIFETNRLLSLKREQLKKTLSALIALSELYVTAMVMAPITFIIMLTILSVLGTAQFGLSPATQLNLIVFFGLPVICILFIVLLDGILPKED